MVTIYNILSSIDVLLPWLKLLVARLGISLALEKHSDHIILESDFLLLARAVGSLRQDHSPLSPAIDDI